jgi:hypothetical protein
MLHKYYYLCRMNQVLVLFTQAKCVHKTRITILFLFFFVCSQGLELQGIFRILLLNRRLIFRSPKFSSSLTSVLRVSVIQDASFLNFPIGCPLYTILYRRLSLLCTTHQHLSLQYQTPLLPLTNHSFSDCIAFEFCDLINYLR